MQLRPPCTSRTLCLSFPFPGTGQVITYQLAAVKPYGMRYKITPETTEKEVNARKCFQLPGSKEDVVTAQSVFPSMRGFKVGILRAQPCPASRSISRLWEEWPGGSSLSEGCRVLGLAGTCPHSPGCREGHFPTRIGAGLLAPFPTPAAVLRRVTSHTNAGISAGFGQASARRLSSCRPQPASGLGTAREQWGQQLVTELDACLHGESLETRRKNLKSLQVFGEMVRPDSLLWVHGSLCTVKCPQGTAEPDGGVWPVLHPTSLPQFPSHAWLCANGHGATGSGWRALGCAEGPAGQQEVWGRLGFPP